MSNLCINYIVGIIFKIEINLHRQKVVDQGAHNGNKPGKVLRGPGYIENKT